MGVIGSHGGNFVRAPTLSGPEGGPPLFLESLLSDKNCVSIMFSLPYCKGNRNFELDFKKQNVSNFYNYIAATWNNAATNNVARCIKGGPSRFISLLGSWEIYVVTETWPVLNYYTELIMLRIVPEPVNYNWFTHNPLTRNF